MLIISPKTHSKTVDQFVSFFNAKKADTPFWHSNFRDYHYVAEVNGVTVHLLFCGYGEGTIYHAIKHGYENFLRKEDRNPLVLYVGACFATGLTDVSVGDLIIGSGAHSDSEIVREIQEKNKNHKEEFDTTYTSVLTDTAKEKDIKTFQGKIYCKETYDRDFWFPFAKEWGVKDGYIAGEVESAACLAACQAIDVPCVGLFEVKDKVDVEDVYTVAVDVDRKVAFGKMLEVIQGFVETI